jgi:hypothetical protein
MVNHAMVTQVIKIARLFLGKHLFDQTTLSKCSIFGENQGRSDFSWVPDGVPGLSAWIKSPNCC